jgi:ABC-type transport system involved in multi-copper enzyme maturation permease subunit
MIVMAFAKLKQNLKLIFVVTRKELLEHFKTKRLIVISLIFGCVFIIISIFGGLIVSGAETDELAYKQGANYALNLVLTFTSMFSPILAIALTFDTIVGERTRKSIELILSKPVSRYEIFIGKFFGAFLSIAIVYMVVVTIGYCIVIAISGRFPTVHDVGIAYSAVGLILLGAACWVILILLFSTIFKTIVSALIFSVLTWLFILSLASQSGLIYYHLTKVEEELPINIDIYTMPERGSNYTTVTFLAHRQGAPIFDINYELRNETYCVVDVRFSRLENKQLCRLPPGYYYWYAYKLGEMGATPPLREGEFLIDGDTTYISTLTAIDSDRYYNDIVFTMMQDDEIVRTGIDLTLKKGETIVYEDINAWGQLLYTNLTEGEYELYVTEHRGRTLIVHSFYSAGEKRAEWLFEAFMPVEEEYPTYVKLIYAINPSNCADTFRKIFDPEAIGVLSVQDAVVALVIFLVVVGASGLLIFRKISLD